ncbi:hypothetical protein FYJ44_10820 [Desulfovibrio sp. PG-178-WT-4]|uniref:Uncharacterized protein n=1 Tax=Desulfovibrio porci TaxID=2605782 RepID=A0A6L5XMX8_9BACT|nr:hypothetical protein [Desulfovibrio porci]
MPREDASNFSFADPLFVVIIRQNQPCRRRKILVFSILPTPAIRLRFAPAEKRWLCPFLSVSRAVESINKIF